MFENKAKIMGFKVVWSSLVPELQKRGSLFPLPFTK